MDKKYQRSLFIFRRDLRLQDNTGLILALNNSDKVICSFIFTPDQIEHNQYKSERCLQFMIESLEELQEDIKAKKGKLYLFFGSPETVVLDCIKKLKIEAVFVNFDYTPYSIKRDERIESVCKKHMVDFYSTEDALLHSVEKTVKKDNSPYSIFTPFYRNASKSDVLPPIVNRHSNYYSESISFSKSDSLYKKILPKRFKQTKGGRSAALKILKNLKEFSKYSKERDFPYLDKTTHLSAHLKFTTCSVREVYHAILKQLGKSSELLRSLYWRDFFTSVAYHYPHVFEGAFHHKFNKLKWNNNKQAFKRWCEGNTGFPIVDAGMRQMNQTGFMHNRVRMIVASFLVKDLHIDWRLGEKYFARSLIDYDPAVNNGNWQWSASTGCDAQPYFRIFNPWAQAIKVDPKCLYIKKWVPEIASLSHNEIHRWGEDLHDKNINYPFPMVDHAKEAKTTLFEYKKVALSKKTT